MEDALSEISYDASLAGLGYNFSSQALGMWVSLNGYNDKMPVLSRTVLEKIRNLVVKPDRLAVMKEQVRSQPLQVTPTCLTLSQVEQDWKNVFLGQPYTLSEYYGRYMMTESSWTIEEKLAEIKCQ